MLDEIIYEEGNVSQMIVFIIIVLIIMERFEFSSLTFML